MITALIVYLVGCVLAGLFIYAVSKQEGDTLDVESVIICGVMIVCSWIAVFFMVRMYLRDWFNDHKGDVVISFKKNK